MGKVAFIIILIAYHHTVLAQIGVQNGIRLNHLSILEGLPEGHVECIIQDKEGYIWIGTRNGLVRFDGYTSKVYGPLLKNIHPFTITALCEDNGGELWVGTAYHGICRYNRETDKFIYYQSDSTNLHSLAAGEIENILSDAYGNVWFTLLRRDKNYQRSIDCFNTKARQFLHYGKGGENIHNVNRNCLAPLFKDKKGNIWSGSENGLMEFDYQAGCFISHLSSVNILNRKTFGNICSDPLQADILWLNAKNTQTGANEGLWRYNTNTKAVKIFRHNKNDPGSLSSDSIFSIQTDSNGQLWIATRNGLSLFHPLSEQFSNYTPVSDHAHPNINLINKFEEDKAGNFWFTTNSGVFNPNTDSGLFAFNAKNKKFTHYHADSTAEDRLGSGKKKNLIIDRFGNLWFSALSEGIKWVNKRKSKFTLYTAGYDGKNSFTGSFLTSVAEAPDHTLWMATVHGLYHWFPLEDSFITVQLGTEPADNPVSSVLVDKDGLVWCAGDEGSTLAGLYCYDPMSKKTTNYRQNKKDSIPATWNDILVIKEDHAGYLWLGTWGGLCKFSKDSKAFTLYRNKSTMNATMLDIYLTNDAVMNIYEDKKYALWIGIHHNSLHKFDRINGDFISYEARFPNFNFVTTIFEDSKYRLWAGSYRDGLMMWDTRSNKMKKITEKDGLLYNGAGDVLEDNQGNLWIKSVRGISILDSSANAIRNLTDDILQEKNQILNRSLKTSGGLFIFPCKYGFVTLNPDDFKPDTIAPVVHIETVGFNMPMTEKKKEYDSILVRYGNTGIHLTYNENRIKFNYVGLLYQNTAQINYKYRLDGYDQNWVAAGTQRTVTYTNLAPGTYTFHVSAANSDGVWSKKEDAVVIVISPPWWQTGWFRAVSILAFAALLFLSLRYFLRRKLKVQYQQFERLQEIEKIRSKISMDIHDEISSGLTKISLLSQRVKAKFESNKEMVPEMMDKIATSSKEVISSLGEIIWAVNPKHDNLQSLLAYLRNYIAGFFEQTNIETRISFPDEVKALAISPDIKHHLFLVTKESLNNIVKHAHASRVDLLFVNTNDTYTFTIADNGNGMDDLNGNDFGNGLTNIQKRMKAINGTITIHSQKGQGTQIILEGRFI